MEAVSVYFNVQRDIDECWEEAFGEPFHILWFLPLDRNNIRNIYLKGRDTEDEKADKEKEEEKKETKEIKENFEDKKELKKEKEKNEVKTKEDKNELKKEKQIFFYFYFNYKYRDKVILLSKQTLNLKKLF